MFTHQGARAAELPNDRVKANFYFRYDRGLDTSAAMLKQWNLWNFFGSVYARLYWLVRNLLPWGNTVQFALIFPARMDHNSVLPPNGGDHYEGGGIANVGTVPFNPLLLQVSAVIGNNNLPGPGPATVTVGLRIYGPTILLNPGEVTGHSFGLSLAAIQSAIPEVTAQTSYHYFGLDTVLRFHNAVAGVNTSVDINYTRHWAELR